MCRYAAENRSVIRNQEANLRPRLKRDIISQLTPIWSTFLCSNFVVRFGFHAAEELPISSTSKPHIPWLNASSIIHRKGLFQIGLTGYCLFLFTTYKYISIRRSIDRLTDERAMMHLQLSFCAALYRGFAFIWLVMANRCS
jgi:hypothetical protein